MFFSQISYKIQSLNILWIFVIGLGLSSKKKKKIGNIGHLHCFSKHLIHIDLFNLYELYEARTISIAIVEVNRGPELVSNVIKITRWVGKKGKENKVSMGLCRLE